MIVLKVNLSPVHYFVLLLTYTYIMPAIKSSKGKHYPGASLLYAP